MSIYGFGIHGGFQAGNGTKNVWRNVSGNHVQGNSRAAGQENGAAIVLRIWQAVHWM